MSVKTYGIYIAYPPTVDLRLDGLGRYLVSFLRGAASRDDVELVIACPSWSKEMLADLLRTEGLPLDRLRILAPRGKPYILMLFDAYQAFLGRERKPGIAQRVSLAMAQFRQELALHFEDRLVNSHSFFTFLPFIAETILCLGVFIATIPLLIVLALLVAVWRKGRKLLSVLPDRLGPLLPWMDRVIASPQDDSWVFRMFTKMADIESTRMLKLIQEKREVRAWYCPTAFWPSFNKIGAPGLMCVPDVVLTEFPIGFSGVGGDRYLQTFETIQQSIRGAENLVTYSNAIKWNTLVKTYNVHSENIDVVLHAPQRLDHNLEISGFPDEEATRIAYCKLLLKNGIARSIGTQIPGSFIFNDEFQFIFYASQFRPNKNVLSLLRAYEYLLRKRLVGHKLILTGRFVDLPEVGEFIQSHNLQKDILCLYGLTVSELAAFYKLADLAVNPSLSEGGCPFTFTEALSVNTPVVMARIPVSEEILVDPELQAVTFFDPYDWKDMAHKIEWALANREQTLEIQLKAYDRLKLRTWADVANEHIAVLERISTQPQKYANP